MAILTRMPRLSIIRGFRGVVDFYVYMGVVCARKWPSSPGHHRAPSVEAQWPNFRNATQLWHQLSPTVQEAYRSMSAGTFMSGYEWFVRGYIGGIFLKELPV